MIETRDEKSQSSIEEQVHGYALPTIAAGVIIALLYWARVIFITAITAVIIALILEPFVGILIRLRFPRSLATFMVGVFAALVLYFGSLAAYNQLSGLAADAPEFKDNLTGFITGVTNRLQDLEDSTAHLLIPARKADQPAAPSPNPPRTPPRRPPRPRTKPPSTRFARPSAPPRQHAPT